MFSTKSKINKIVENIKPYNPDKVILFGSRAWGKPHRDSDFDLMVIKNTREKYSTRFCKVRKLLRNFGESFDIIVMTPDEIRDRKKINDLFVKNILKNGKVIYATEDA